MLNKDNFGEKLYNRFPAKYKEDDALVDYALKKYFEAASEGGFNYIIDNINGLCKIIDPDSAPSKVLPKLFYQYGFELFNGIPEQYLRWLLPNISTLWGMKGSISILKYLTSSLTGIKTEVSVTHKEDGTPLSTVKVEMDTSEIDRFPDSSQLKRVLDNFVPFFCDTAVVLTYSFAEPINSSVLEDFDTSLTISQSDTMAVSITEDIHENIVYILNDDVATSFDYESDPTLIGLSLSSGLNTNFKTNNLPCYDKITTGGNTVYSVPTSSGNIVIG